MQARQRRRLKTARTADREASLMPAISTNMKMEICGGMLAA
jgi:hypothetical protein